MINWANQRILEMEEKSGQKEFILSVLYADQIIYSHMADDCYNYSLSNRFLKKFSLFKRGKYLENI